MTINKQLQEIQELKERLQGLEKELQQQKQSQKKRWRPCRGKIYWAVSDKDGEALVYPEFGDDFDNYHYNSGNCFKTEWQALAYRDNVLIKQQLKDLALELNNGVAIDWRDDTQIKYYIYLAPSGLYIDSTNRQVVSQVCCLSNLFLSEALAKIGKENIIKLIKSGV